ncbi:MAG TPA: OmpA family protein, partial [Gemmatimonadota bacterium]|nr:OmpA family protein [Gemmatimonadota bacterium]
AAQDAAQNEAANQVDRMVRDAIRCAVDDPACAESAQAAGKPVVYTDSSGKVITDADGNPISDQASAQAATQKPGEGAWANYDFIPGDRVLFAEDLSSDKVGDFPRRLDFKAGTMEIVEWQGRRLLHVTNDPSVFQIPLGETLPDRFTIEFDIYSTTIADGVDVVTAALPDGGAPGYSGDKVNFGSWRGSGVWRGFNPLSTDKVAGIDKGLVHARIMADGKYVKVFADEQRVANVPQVDLGRSDAVTFLVHGHDDVQIYLGNFRIAAGGADLYDRLAADGRATTHGILFDVDSDRIRPESTPTLKEIAEMLKAHPDLRLSIEGHTDATGDAKHNQELSERRAASVKTLLVSDYGIDAGRLETAGFGASKPVADNGTPEGRQENRRVELVKLGG